MFEGPLQHASKNWLPHQESLLLRQSRKLSIEGKTRKYGNGKLLIPTIHLVPVSAIAGPCIGVPNLQSYTRQNKGKSGRPLAGRPRSMKHATEVIVPDFDLSYIFVQPKTKWPKILMDYINDLVDNHKEHDAPQYGEDADETDDKTEEHRSARREEESRRRRLGKSQRFPIGTTFYKVSHPFLGFLFFGFVFCWMRRYTCITSKYSCLVLQSH